MVEQSRDGHLFSVRRIVFVFVLASLVAVSDMLVFHLADIGTTTELIEQTLVLGFALYFAYTMIAVFGTEIRL